MPKIQIHTVNLQQDEDSVSNTFGDWYAWVRYTVTNDDGSTRDGNAHLNIKRWHKSVASMIEAALAQNEKKPLIQKAMAVKIKRGKKK